MTIICPNQRDFTRQECVATIGVFDGVHKGHQHLIGMVAEQSRLSGRCATVITFDRLPRQVFDPTFRPQLLTTLEEKEAAVSELGIDQLVVLPFTRELAGLTAKEFMQQVLREQLNVRTLIIGYDNRFGHNRTEGFDDYVRYGQDMGMQVLQGDAAMMADGSCAVSSSVIRRLLSEEGKVELMPDCLTRPYQLMGRVTSGEHIGHRLGFPTANLEPVCPDKLIPLPGVYAVWAELESGQKLQAMMNIGTRPTFEGHQQTLEVNIFDFNDNLYGQCVRISFVARLRDERRFDSPEALVSQLKKDKQAIINILEK